MDQFNAFTNFLYVVPEPIKHGDSGIPIKWDFKDLKLEDIEDVVPGCGCTAEISINSEGITATYHDNTKAEDIPKTAPWFFQTKKVLTVYIKDGEPIKIPGPKGMNFNPKKTKVKIYFHACVV